MDTKEDRNIYRDREAADTVRSMERTPQTQINRVVFCDDEGVGRCNLFKALAVQHQRSGTKNYDRIDFEAVGREKPKSGTTTIHEDVVEIVRYRTRKFNQPGVDISDWPINTLDPLKMHEDGPSKITDKTIVVWLSYAPVPEEIVQSAFAVLIAYNQDPFGSEDMPEKLNRMATMVGYYLWLLEIAISHPDELERKVKKSDGKHEARYLVELEPKGIEQKYDFDNWMNTMH